MNRNYYKDTLFRNYFLESKRLLSICNVLLGTNSDDVNDIAINTPTGKFMLTVFAALSQLEREQLKQRQREGIEIGKA